MSTWRAFIDDSGSDGSVLNKDFTPKAIDPMDGTTKLAGMMSPVSTVALVAFESGVCDRVCKEVRKFQEKIQHDYRIAKLPKIHMRHLWGRKARFDNGKNPFFDLDESDRLIISTQAYNLAAKLKDRYHGYCSTFASHPYLVQGEFQAFYNKPVQVLEREILYSHFNRKVVDKFYRLLSHGTMGIVASATMDFNNFCARNKAAGIINYDDSDASKGFEAPDLFNALHEQGWAESVRHGSHSAVVNHSFLQLADLMTFAIYRRKLSAFRGDPQQENDPFREVSRSVASMINNDVPVSQIEARPREGMSVHYQVARAYLLSNNPTWVTRHLKTFAELQTDAAGASDGAPIIREASHIEYAKTKTLS